MSFDENLPTPAYISIIYRKHASFINKNTKDVNLTFGLYPLLITIYKEEEIIQEDLAKLHHLNESTITRNLNKLETKGFITRTPYKRKKIITLTDLGEKTVQDIIDYDGKWDEVIKKELGEEKFNDYKKTLKKISNILLKDELNYKFNKNHPNNL